MQGSARKDVVFGVARVYPVTAPGPKWKSWLKTAQKLFNATEAGMFPCGECITPGHVFRVADSCRLRS